MEICKVNKLAYIIIIVMLFSGIMGCYDMHELESQAFVLCYGIDKGAEKGFLSITFLIAVPKSLAGSAQGGGGGGGEKDNGVIAMTIDAPSIPNAIDMATNFIGRTVSFDQAGFVFFSEKFVKEDDIERLSFFQRYNESRRSNRMFVVKGKTSEFLKKIKPKLTANPNKYLAQLINTEKDTGLIPDVNLHKFYTAVESKVCDAVLPLCAVNEMAESNVIPKGENYSKYLNYYAGKLPRQGGLPIEFFGSAVFSSSRMVEELDGNETRLLNLIKGDFHRGFFVFPCFSDKNKFNTLMIKEGKGREISVDISGEVPKIKIKIYLEGEISATGDYTDFSKVTNVNKLEKQAISNIHDRMLRLIKKLQQKNVDPFNFGKSLQRDFLYYTDLANYGWFTKDKYKKAAIDLKVYLQIRRVGYQLFSSQPVRKAD